MSEMCTSCGDTDVYLTSVHRVYVTPADWDRDESRRTAAEIEVWCDVCLVHYPHEVVGAEG